jgi:chromosome segregation ATPase
MTKENKMDYKAVDNKLEVTEAVVKTRSIEEIKDRISRLNTSIGVLQAELAIEQAQLDKCSEFGIKEASVLAAEAVAEAPVE